MGDLIWSDILTLVAIVLLVVMCIALRIMNKRSRGDDMAVPDDRPEPGTWWRD